MKSDFGIEDDNPSFSRTIVVTKNHRFHESFPTTLGFGKSKARIFSTSMVSISFEVPYSWSADGSLDDDAQRIRMEVFDLRGRKIATLVDRNLRPGSYDAYWRGKSYSGRQVAAGMYAITLSNKQSRDVMKIVKK
ncbi:MAG: FlgD immunoglobulin-like domain containing protein [Chitinispirillaceae bacterium]